MSKSAEFICAVVGSGPAAFYAVEALLAQTDVDCRVDIYDKRFAPFGLVRFGVAPDHPKIKSVTKRFSALLNDERVRFFGNVEIGRDIPFERLRNVYDAVILAVGAPGDFKLGVAGENLPGVFSAREFVGWFNCDFENANLSVDLDTEAVAIIGVGNVAMDVARILLQSPDELAKTDIADHALAALRNSKVKRVHLIARRGPAQIACTLPELKELCSIKDVSSYLHVDDIRAGVVNEAEEKKETKKILQFFEGLKDSEPATGDDEPKQLHFHFLCSPREFTGEGKLEALKLYRNELVEKNGRWNAEAVEGSEFALPIGLSFRAIRYKGVPFSDLPFDDASGVIPNDRGAVEANPGLYVAGWIKRGATGVIGTNKPDAKETVATLLRDLSEGKIVLKDVDRSELLSPQALVDSDKVLEVVSKEDWFRIDAEELRKGEHESRTRVRFVFAKDALAFLGR
jgi:ferredoxin--NADP+ reductase